MGAQKAWTETGAVANAMVSAQTTAPFQTRTDTASGSDSQKEEDLDMARGRGGTAPKEPPASGQNDLLVPAGCRVHVEP